MKKMIPFDEEQASYLDRIIQSKRATLKLMQNDSMMEIPIKPILTSMQRDIINSYNEYQEKKEDLSKINLTSCDSIQKKALNNCYDQSTIALDELKGKIKLNQPISIRSTCQFCGINASDTFDHYIPKSKNPEYAVYGPNLIPCCSSCNSLKGEKWSDDNNLFINLYYDEIPSDIIIHASILFDKGTPFINFKLYDFEDEIANWKTVQSHYNLLKLPTRFKENCNSYLSEMILSLNKRNKKDEGSIIMHLNEELEITNEIYGVNHWKPVLIKSLLSSSEFLEFIIAQ